MKPDDLEQLLGGYATGSLTPEEQKLLFEAALRDQELFDALVREQGLKEALDEPAVRHELIAELEQTHPSWRERLAAWLRPRYPIGAAALAVSAAVVMIVALVRTGDRSTDVKPVEVAEVRQPAAPAAEREAPAARAPDAATPAPRRAKAPVSNEAQPPAGEPAALLDQAAPKEAPAPAAGGVVGGVIGGIVSGPAPAAAPPPPPAPALAESRVVEDRALKTATTSAFRDEGGGLQARELFYRSDFQPSGAGGVVGGYPGASMRQGERKAAAPATRVAQPLGLRYAIARKDASAQINVEANSDSVLYVFRQSASGEWIAVTPGGLSLKAHASATVPDVAAPAQVLMLLSRRPLPELAQTGAALSGTLEKLEAGSNPERLVTQQVDQSTYVVAPLPRPAEVLVVKTEVNR